MERLGTLTLEIGVDLSLIRMEAKLSEELRKLSRRSRAQYYLHIAQLPINIVLGNWKALKATSNRLISHCDLFLLKIICALV